MRKTKFRAWDKEEKKIKMVREILFDQYGGVDVFLECDDINEQAKGADILMQFTGLKDKNGKEIYKNDILSFKRRNNEVVEIKWKDDGFKCGVKTSDNCTTWYGLNHFLEKYQCEIIGNIYENSNLLK